MTEAEAVALLDTMLPAPVREVCAALSRAGHEAFTVGGAVRDALLGRAPGDWDVATSATPEQVMATFARTVPTGIKHGTVTVLAGKERMPVEVTTFRGEGAYTDGRRPDTVVFGVPLHEDLARRDFVINAIAYDPMRRVLADPFGGRHDLAAQRVRAVGDARQRFSEDGLRVMRAVRFAATLGFALDPATEAAIPQALEVLARVSWERVRQELLKLLAAPLPSRGLVVARRTGVLGVVLPELGLGPAPGEEADPDQARWDRLLVRVDAARGLIVRVAALLVEAEAPLPPPRSEAHPLRRLKMSNAEIDAVDRLLRHADAWREDLDNAALRARLGDVGRAHADELVALWRAEAEARTAEFAAMESAIALAARARVILEAGDPLVAAELALSGDDIMRILQIPPGREVGELLSALLAHVREDPALNEPERLRELVRALHAARPASPGA